MAYKEGGGKYSEKDQIYSVVNNNYVIINKYIIHGHFEIVFILYQRIVKAVPKPDRITRKT